MKMETEKDLWVMSWIKLKSMSLQLVPFPQLISVALTVVSLIHDKEIKDL